MKEEDTSNPCPLRVESHDLYWIARLPVSDLTDIMEIVVSGNHLGMKIAEKR